MSCLTGIDDKALEERKEKGTVQPVKLSKKQMKLKKRQQNTLTQAAKKKKQKEVLVLDYAKKRGANKERKPENEKEEEVEMMPEIPKVRAWSSLLKFSSLSIISLARYMGGKSCISKVSK